jgi:hypothetical protein
MNDKWQNKLIMVRFQVRMAMNMKMAVFRNVAPCSLADIERHFIAQMMEAVSISET